MHYALEVTANQLVISAKSARIIVGFTLAFIQGSKGLRV